MENSFEYDMNASMNSSHSGEMIEAEVQEPADQETSVLVEEESAEAVTNNFYQNTYSLLRAESKPLLESKLSNDILINTLKHEHLELECQIQKTKSKIKDAKEKNRHLEMEVQIDQNRLRHSVERMTRNNNILVALENSVEKLEMDLKNCSFLEMCDKIKQQRDEIQSLEMNNNQKLLEIKKQKEGLLEEKNNKKKFLKREFEYWQDKYTASAQKCEDLKQANLFYDEEIETRSAEKKRIDEKLIKLNEQNAENEIIELGIKDQEYIQHLECENEYFVKQRDKLEKKKIELELILQHYNEEFTVQVHTLEDKKAKLTLYLKELETKHSNIKSQDEDIMKELGDESYKFSQENNTQLLEVSLKIVRFSHF